MQHSEFLHGKGLSERIKYVCAGREVSCAVAFLGRGMSELLFPHGCADVRVLCDISMGCTSQRALQEFGAPINRMDAGNDRLHLRNGLHGKVYLSDRGAVIGSPNLSGRGLGRSLQGDWNLETGVFAPVGSAVWRQTKDWLDGEFDRTFPVSWRDVMEASEHVWDPGRPPSPDELTALSLFDRLTRFPDAFAQVAFVFTDSKLDTPDQKMLLDEADQTTRARLDVIVWSNEEDAIDYTGVVISIHRKGRRRSVHGYVRAFPSPIRPELVLYGTASWSGVQKALGQPDLSKRLSREEWRIVDAINNGDQTVFSSSELQAYIARKTAPDAL